MLLVLVIQPILAIDLEINKISSSDVLIYGLNNEATFELEITNNERTNNFEFYNLLGFPMEPKSIKLEKGEKTKVTLKIKQPDNFNQEGAYFFTYFISSQEEEMEREAILKSLKLEDVFKISAGELNPESNKIRLFIENQENIELKDVSFEMTSSFFDSNQEFDFAPKEKHSFEMELIKEDFKQLSAGFYTINSKISIGDLTTTKESVLEFEEKDLLVEEKDTYGFIVTTDVIKKTNDGNTITTSRTTVEKNIISRLFTSSSPEPTSVERQGGKIIYIWNNEIQPGESIEIKTSTNWIFPFLVIFLLLAVVYLTKKYSKTNILLRKKVTFVKAKGGEFALKVSIYVHAKNYLERIVITDRLPPLVKLYEKFGIEKPTRIDEKNKKIEWEFEKLESGEVRVINYIIYSKIGVMGKFALPRTTAIYEREGQIKEAESNKAFFVSEAKQEKKE